MRRVEFDRRTMLVGLVLLMLPAILVFFGPTEFRVSKEPEDDKRLEAQRRFFEHKIGGFSESNQQFPSAPLNVNLQVYAEVPVQQNGEFHVVFNGRENHFRSAVSEVLRGARVQDLREPELATLKRKMKVALVSAHGQETSVFDNLIVPEYEARRVN